MCVQGILLIDEIEKMDSLNLLRRMAPIAALMLIPAIMILEPEAPGSAISLIHAQPLFGLLLVGNSSLAYLVNFTNLQITKNTSPLTLQVQSRACESSLRAS